MRDLLLATYKTSRELNQIQLGFVLVLYAVLTLL